MTVNVQILDTVYQCYSPNDIPFLIGLKQKMSKDKPYLGLKIFQNIPLTMEAVLKIIPLILGGAEVTVSCITALQPQQKALDILEQANVPVNLNHDIKQQFDIYLDCCAELANAIAPSLGSVELTASGTNIYKKMHLNYPVISVDDSKIKYLEGIGTGMGFVNGLKKFIKDDFKNKKFVVFGYGKIGRGIVTSLKNLNANIVVVEKDINLVSILNDKGIKALISENKGSIKQHLKDSFCVVTATGVVNCISDNFDKNDFNNAYLANMGPEDEYGYKFTTSDVLFDKKPINFAADSSTEMRYLDPILYAHNIAIDLLISGELTQGYHPFPDGLANDILKKWSIYHKQNVDTLLDPKYFYGEQSDKKI